jgi:hypothetical protein
MSNPFELALEEARGNLAEGRIGHAERGYARAAELARSNADPVGLAHALRHSSDLARERGERSQAREHACEAIELYRKGNDRLGLANAIRLKALSAANAAEAKACWLEARELYSALDIPAGVSECDSHLPD